MSILSDKQDGIIARLKSGELVMSALRRIGWLDSANMPARIHLTADNGETTLCGHEPREQVRQGRWKIKPDVPRKIDGRSRYCKVCFCKGGKTLPFIEE